MCAILFYTMTCPHCGNTFLHCNGGDIVVSINQISPRCPKCKKRTNILFKES